MIDDEEIDDFLEHHGVMGMRWGKSGSGKSNNTSGSKVIKTAAQKKARRDKILKGVEIVGIVAAGAIAASYILKKHRAHLTKLRDIEKLNNKLAIPFLAKYGNTPKTVWHQPGPIQTSKHTRQLAELDILTNFMGSKTHGPLGR